jgi:hypothetical protein
VKRVGLRGKGGPEPEFSQQDRERVIELLLSRERVLYLLYEKTFPADEDESKMMEKLEEEEGAN